MTTQTKQNILAQAYEDYGGLLLRRSFFKVSDYELADDLVQTTFMKTWEYLQKSDKIGSIKSFLFRVLNNLIIDEYRKKKPVSLDLMSENGFEVAVEDSDRVVNSIDGKSAATHIPKLQKRYRDAISMYYMKNMTIKEISETTHQSTNTVAVQIHRGVKKLGVMFLK